MINEYPSQHHGTRDRQSDPEHDAGRPRPAERLSGQHTQQCRNNDLAERSRDRDGSNGKQILYVEMQSHAEHQQNDADFSELVGQRAVGDKTWRVRTYDEPGEQITHDWR